MSLRSLAAGLRSLGDGAIAKQVAAQLQADLDAATSRHTASGNLRSKSRVTANGLQIEVRIPHYRKFIRGFGWARGIPRESIQRAKAILKRAIRDRLRS